MEEMRPDSEQLLKRIQYEEKREREKNRGKMKVFLGYAAGTGKTYAMLEAAHEAEKSGIDVVAGYIEPHNRPDTEALREGLEEIPPLMVDYKGIQLREFDLDAALKRRPQLLLVDELAHTNVRGCRNEKRYQDVMELLQAGISVYSTVNIQHLESLNDLVGSITGIQVRERIPDYVFDQADQVEVIDIEPDDLIRRMKEGKIYGESQAERALSNFFRREKLVALREIALRRTADRVSRMAEEERSLSDNQDYHTGEHILVCITAAPSSAKVIRTAARLADAFRGRLTGLVVETAKIREADEKTKAALRENMEIAKVLGARVVTVCGSDVASQIAQYARISNVSKIVLGRTNHLTIRPMYRSELLEKLTYLAPNIDVYIIPDMRQTKRYHPSQMEKRKKGDWRKTVLDLSLITAVMAAAAFLSLAFLKLGLSGSDQIILYLLGVLISSYIADRKIYSLYSALLSVVLYNFFCIEPLYSLKAYDRGDSVTFILLFFSGFFAAAMTRKLKQQNVESAKIAYRTGLLLENSQRLRRCRREKEVWALTAAQAGKLLNLSVLIYPVDKKGRLGTAMVFPRPGMSEEEFSVCLSTREKGVAQWTAANGHRAGASTHTLPDSLALYLPIQDEDQVKGVMGIYLEERRPIAEFEYNLLTAMLSEAAVKLKDTFPQE